MKPVAYTRLETDAEARARASLVAGHLINPACCGATHPRAETTDEALARHNVYRRIVEVLP